MERLELRHEVLLKALHTLNEPIEKINQVDDPSMYRMIRDSLIQRFEYSYDVFWKFLKDYLKFVHGLEVVSPRLVFQSAREVGFISVQEFDQLIKLMRDRNETSHVYKEVIAQEISEHIPAYYQLMMDVAKRLAQ